jgi:hypothetical protein
VLIKNKELVSGELPLQARQLLLVASREYTSQAQNLAAESDDRTNKQC